MDIYVLVTLIASMTSIIIAVSVLFFNYYKEVTKNRKQRYDFEKHMAELENMRNYYEEKIYEMNERMSSSQERFKDLNHLLLGSWEKSPEELSPEVSHIPNFIKDAGIEKSDVYIEEDLVFVLTPFNDKMESTYRLIKDVCKKNRLKCKRGDEEFIQGDIFPHILKHILKARIIIANINGRNPNVFYELGIAHTLDKPSLIVAKNLSDAPFDVRSKRMILYDNETELRDKLDKNIRNALIKL